MISSIKSHQLIHTVRFDYIRDKICEFYPDRNWVTISHMQPNQWCWVVLSIIYNFDCQPDTKHHFSKSCGTILTFDEWKCDRLHHYYYDCQYLENTENVLDIEWQCEHAVTIRFEDPSGYLICANPNFLLDNDLFTGSIVGMRVMLDDNFKIVVDHSEEAEICFSSNLNLCSIDTDHYFPPVTMTAAKSNINVHLDDEEFGKIGRSLLFYHSISGMRDWSELVERHSNSTEQQSFVFVFGPFVKDPNIAVYWTELKELFENHREWVSDYLYLIPTSHCGETGNGYQMPVQKPSTLFVGSHANRLENPSCIMVEQNGKTIKFIVETGLFTLLNKFTYADHTNLWSNYLCMGDFAPFLPDLGLLVEEPLLENRVETIYLDNIYGHSTDIIIYIHYDWIVNDFAYHKYLNVK
jgi:hypothetical protein